MEEPEYHTTQDPWPPRHPLSEEFHQLEDVDFPPALPQLPAVLDEVFEDENNSDTEMPARPEEIALQAFKRSYRNWNQNFDLLKARADILPLECEDMKKKRTAAEELADTRQAARRWAPPR